MRHCTPFIIATGASFLHALPCSSSPTLLAFIMATSPPAKKQRMIFTDSLFREQFEEYRDKLNAMHEQRERLVKASRDVTIHSKKVIFQVHRLNTNNKEVVLEQAERDLATIRTDHVMRVVKEMQGKDFWKFRRAYTPGMQEYVEAATFLEYCKNGNLLKLEDLNKRVSQLKDASDSPFTINMSDYLLGVGDLTGELMRLAISRVTDGEPEMAKGICNFVRCLYGNLNLLAHNVDDSWEMKQKMDTMLQSLTKIENTCYTVHVRGSEYLPGANFVSMDGHFSVAAEGDAMV